MQNTILIIIVSILFSSFSLSQNHDFVTMKYIYELKNNGLNKFSNSDDTLNFKPKIKKLDFNIGVQVGSHSQNLTKNSSLNFNRDIFLELYISFDLSNEVQSIIAFTYWKSQTKEINTPVLQIPAETINSKGLKFELDFSLFKIYNASFALGPSISIENITRANGAVFSLGTNLKLNLPLWDDKVNLLTTVNYQNGSEILNFGGGISYSFFTYLIGVEINI